jgi:hypothetical protein
LAPTLAAYVGEAVTIRYDPHDLGEVRVFHENRFRCRAISFEHAGEPVTLKDVQAARALRRRELRGQINERIRPATEYLAPADSVPTPAAISRPEDAKIFAALRRSRTLLYTPTIGLSPIALSRRLQSALDNAGDRMNMDRRGRVIIDIELIIVDEIERLSASALEALRDLFDRSEVGLILVGMPGMEKRMARYPQLYSRVGFAHHYRSLQGDELSFVLARHWRKLGLSLDTADFSDTQAVASIARITGGNFRLLHRLFVQIERVLKLNGLTFVTDEVVNAARSTLVIGAT